MTAAANTNMKHIIDQATFDEAVKENVELLDMEVDEAIIEARTQFTTQNVDLSNIITDSYRYGGIENHPFVKSFNELKSLVKAPVLNEQDIIKATPVVTKEMNNDKARKLYVGNNGGYSIGMELLRRSQPESEAKFHIISSDKSLTRDNLQLVSLIFLEKVLNGYPDLLDSNDVPLILSILQREANREDIEAYSRNIHIRVLLDLISCTLVLHENNRELWANSSLLDILPLVLSHRHYHTLLRVLRIFCALSRDDDIRVEVSNAHERTRKITDRYLADLTRLVGEVENLSKTAEVSGVEKVTLSSLLLKTITCLCVRNEHCTIVLDNGGLAAIQEIARQSLTQILEGKLTGEDVDLLIALMRLAKTISGNDDVKNSVAESGLVELIVELVNVIGERKNSIDCTGVYESYLLMLATLTLRHAAVCGKLLEYSILEVILNLMKSHPGNAKIVKYSSWCLHNILCKHSQAVESLLDMGGAEVLTAALKRHPGIGYDIKNAMKELGDAVDVKFEEQWTGKGQVNFNPEY